MRREFARLKYAKSGNRVRSFVARRRGASPESSFEEIEVVFVVVEEGEVGCEEAQIWGSSLSDDVRLVPAEGPAVAGHVAAGHPFFPSPAGMQ